MNGVNDHLMRYKNRVVGNHPYLMPLDAHLNQDIHAAFDYHAVISKHLPDSSPIKFFRKTPNLMEKGYSKLWDSTRPEGEECPSSHRIIHNIHQVVHVAYPQLYQTRRVALYHDTRRGRRDNETVTELVIARGGARTKSEEYDLNDIWVNESVRHLQRESILRSESRYRNLPESSVP